MFAVIRQQLILVFAKAGPGPLQDINPGIYGVWLRLNFYPFSCGKAVQRNIFNGASFRGVMKAPIVNNLSIPCINSVMDITYPLTNKMGTNRNSAFCAGPRRSGEAIK